MRNVAWASLLAVSLAALSCGDDEDDSASGFVAAFCDVLQPCCAMAKRPADGKQCRSLVGTVTGQARYDKRAGQACLAEARAALGRAELCEGVPSEAQSVCDGVFDLPRGSKQPGEDCSDDLECAKSSEGEVQCPLIFGPAGRTQQCQLSIRGKEGDKPCLGTWEGGLLSSNIFDDAEPARGYVCYVSDGLYCDSRADTCSRLKTPYQPCAGDIAECVRTAYCDLAAGLCAERKALGTACVSRFSTRECVPGAWCAEATGVCTAQVAEGESCAGPQACLSSRCLNGRCERRSTGGGFDLDMLCGRP